MAVMLERWNDEKMDELAGKVDGLGTDVAVLNTKVDVLDKRLERIDGRLDALHRTLLTAAVGVPAAYAVLSRLIS